MNNLFCYFVFDRQGFSVAILKGLKCEFKKLRIINTRVLRNITQRAFESIAGEDSGGEQMS